MSYGYLNSTYDFEELSEMEFRSNFDITHSITSSITFSTASLNLALGANWRTGKPFTPPVPDNEVIDGEINYDSANSNELDDFLRLDFSAIYSTKIGKKTKLQTGISVWNLLNRVNPINTFFRVNPQEEAQQVLQESLGITPNASVKLLFWNALILTLSRFPIFKLFLKVFGCTISTFNNTLSTFVQSEDFLIWEEFFKLNSFKYT